MTQMDLSQRLRNLRERARLSIVDCATEYGISKTQWANYETGQAELIWPKLMEMAAVVNLAFRRANSDYERELGELQSGRSVVEPAAATA